MLISEENTSTLFCKAIRFLARCEIIWIIDNSRNTSSFADWYGSSRYDCVDVSRRRCGKYQEVIELEMLGRNRRLCRNSPNANVQSYSKASYKVEKMGCTVVVNVAKCVKIMSSTVCR